MGFKVLLAIDSSECSKAVVDEALDRPWPSGTLMFVLSAVDLFALTNSVGYLEPLAKNSNDAARALTQSVADRLASKDIESVTHVVDGYPATAIVEQAKMRGADFILVGSHGHGGFGRFFLGSIAREVLRNAHCSVGIVRPARDKDLSAAARKILLATDGSSFSECAARSIAERPWREGSEVKIISVVDPVIPATDPWYASGEVVDQIREQRQTECEQAVKSAKELLSGARLTTSASVLEGIVKHRILDEAQKWGADIIVVGSHGRRGLTRLLLGSVSEAVAMNAPCSVEVIRKCTVQ
jgi:nucleotide-binding universal stress UspA family protein